MLQVVGYLAKSDAVVKKKKKYRPRGRHFRDGYRVAALHAFTAAELLLEGKISSLKTAAIVCGSTPQYIAAALVILKSENKTLASDAVHGKVPLLTAARSCRRLALLVEAYRKASPTDRAAFGRQVGPVVLWDQAVTPALSD